MLPFRGGINAKEYRKIINFNLLSLVRQLISKYGGILWGIQDELGSAACAAYPSNIYDGVYVGVTLEQTGLGEYFSGLWDGANDYVQFIANIGNINSNFNPSQGAWTCITKVSNAAVWTDGQIRSLGRWYADGNNQIGIYKYAAANTLRLFYNAGAGGADNKIFNVTTSTTDWLMPLISWDKTNDEAKAFVNGAQQGITQNSLGVWAGNLSSFFSCLGADQITPAFVYSGNTLFYLLLFGTPTPTEVFNLALAAGLTY